MKKSELVDIIREVIREELTKNKLVRKYMTILVREEVKSQMKQLITEMESKVMDEPLPQSVEQFDAGIRHGLRLQDMVEHPPKKPVVKNQPQGTKQFVKNNTVLNNMLNETAGDIMAGRAQVPSAAPGSIDGVNPAYLGNVSNFAAQQQEEETEESTGKSVASMMPTHDVNGNPMMKNPLALPEGVQKALTKDYSKFMKKVDNKSKGML